MENKALTVAGSNLPATPKVVTIFTTAGQNGKKVNFSGTTWGELKTVFRENGVNYEGMKAVIGGSQLTVEADAAALPSENFKMFLLPVKTKSGVSESRARIQGIIKKYSDKGKAHFNKDKNYTQKKEDELVKLLKTWDKKGLPDPTAKELAEFDAPKEKAGGSKSSKETTSGATKKPVKPEVAKAVSSVVGKIKADKEKAIGKQAEAPKPQDLSLTQEEIEEGKAEMNRLLNTVPGVDPYKANRGY